MGIVGISIVQDSSKNALCYNLRHENGEVGEIRKSKWSLTPEEKKTEICSRCPLAWNNGGCEGKFGPNYSSLPIFARRFGCEVIADVPKGHDQNKVYPSSQAQKLLDEVKLLREKLKFEKDTVFVPKEDENIPDDQIRQWLSYTVGFDGVVPRKINALRVHEETLDRLEKMAKTCVDNGCEFAFP